MSRAKGRHLVNIQAKRNVELWIYSFADMYMILSVFFIALAVVYAAKTAKVSREEPPPLPPTMGQGPIQAESAVALDFESGSADLTQAALENLQTMLPFYRGVKKGLIEVEGYADAARLDTKSPFSSNLDLSNRRAVKVAEWLIANGIGAQKIRTLAYGDSRLYRLNGKDVRTNRRVVIKVASLGAP